MSTTITSLGSADSTNRAVNSRNNLSAETHRVVFTANAEIEVTGANATEILTNVDHKLSSGDAIILSSGTPFAGTQLNNIYWVEELDDDTFHIHLTKAAAVAAATPLGFTDDGTTVKYRVIDEDIALTTALKRVVDFTWHLTDATVDTLNIEHLVAKDAGTTWPYVVSSNTFTLSRVAVSGAGAVETTAGAGSAVMLNGDSVFIITLYGTG